MAQGVSGPPVALEVHVTGRRILATIVDAIVFSVIFATQKNRRLGDMSANTLVVRK